MNSNGCSRLFSGLCNFFRRGNNQRVSDIPAVPAKTAQDIAEDFDGFFGKPIFNLDVQVNSEFPAKRLGFNPVKTKAFANLWLNQNFFVTEKGCLVFGRFKNLPEKFATVFVDENLIALNFLRGCVEFKRADNEKGLNGRKVVIRFENKESDFLRVDKDGRLYLEKIAASSDIEY